MLLMRLVYSLVLLLLVTVRSAAERGLQEEKVAATDKNIANNVVKNITSWTFQGCETGSVDAPNSDDVFVWFYLQRNVSDERVINVGAVPEWSTNRTLVCRNNVFLVDPAVSSNVTLYNQTQVYPCPKATPELCQMLKDQSVPCSYDQNGVWSNGSCRRETKAAKCEIELFGQAIIAGGTPSINNNVDSSPLLGVGGTANDGTSTNTGDSTLADAPGVNVTLRRSSNIQGERLAPLSSWPMLTTIVAGENDGPYLEYEHYSLLFDRPRFGRGYVLTKEERVLNQTIATRSYITPARPGSTSSVPYSTEVDLTAVSVEWTGRVTYQAIFIPDDDEPCQSYTSQVIEFHVDAPWYAKADNTYEECKLCESRGGIGQDSSTTGDDAPLRYRVEEGDDQYSHSCESLFIAGARGRIPTDQCPIVQEYPCCADSSPSASSSSSRVAATASGLTFATISLVGLWLIMVF
jgi:hypothetical protein